MSQEFSERVGPIEPLDRVEAVALQIQDGEIVDDVVIIKTALEYMWKIASTSLDKYQICLPYIEDRKMLRDLVYKKAKQKGKSREEADKQIQQYLHDAQENLNNFIHLNGIIGKWMNEDNWLPLSSYAQNISRKAAEDASDNPMHERQRLFWDRVSACASTFSRRVNLQN